MKSAVLERRAAPTPTPSSPQPLSSPSVKLLKSLTVANDAFVVGTHSKRFGNGCYSPCRRAFGGGSGRDAGPLTGAGRGDGDYGQDVNGASSKSLLPSLGGGGVGLKDAPSRTGRDTQTRY